MFIQVIQGKASDAEALKGQLDRWGEELASGAEGYLGSTGGVTEDGDFVVLARFESEEAARANSDRPEQGAWWENTKGHFEGDVTFLDCPEADTFGAGGSDDAGFVQVMQGRADRDQVRAAVSGVEEVLGTARPEIIGGVVPWPGDGTFIQVVYFTSEADARKGERTDPSPEQAEVMGRIGEWMQVERYVDLRNPWLASP